MQTDPFDTHEPKVVRHYSFVLNGTLSQLEYGRQRPLIQIQTPSIPIKQDYSSLEEMQLIKSRH